MAAIQTYLHSSHDRPASYGMGVVAILFPLMNHIVIPCGWSICMSKPSPARYCTTNGSSYTPSLRKRGSLLIWLDKNMT